MEVDQSQPSTSKATEKKSDHDDHEGSSINLENRNRVQLHNSLQEAFARISSNKGK